MDATVERLAAGSGRPGSYVQFRGASGEDRACVEVGVVSFEASQND